MSNHLSSEEKRKPSNWWLLLLTEVVTYATKEEGRTAAAKRHRAAYHHAVLTRVLRPLHGAFGTTGCSCVDIGGEPCTYVGFVQGARLDHPEVMASARTKHSAWSEVASKAQFAQHPPNRPMRDAEATERLVTRALERERARAAALAADGPNAAERRRTKRRLDRSKRRLARRGLHCLPNAFFGLRRTHPYFVYTWSELHIIWQGIIKNVINLLLEYLSGLDEWGELRPQLDAAFTRWAGPMATVRGKAKTGGVSRLLAREGDVRLSMCTKLDIYGFALFLLPLLESTNLLTEDMLKGTTLLWRWVSMTRSCNPSTGERELRLSQLRESGAQLARALAPLKRAFPHYKFATSKFNNSFLFGLRLRSW